MHSTDLAPWADVGAAYAGVGFNVGPEKILLVLLIALVLLGPRELPDAARKLGNVLRDCGACPQDSSVNSGRRSMT